MMTYPARRGAGEDSVLVLSDEPWRWLPEVEARGLPVEVCRSYEALPAALDARRPTVVLGCKVGRDPFPREALLGCPTLRWLSLTAAGIEHLGAWDEDRVAVTNVGDLFAGEMARYALMAVIGLHQNVQHHIRAQARREWAFREPRSTRGITVGLGAAGQAIAQACRAAGFGIVACRSSAAPSPLVDRVYGPDALHDMLATVDAVVLCAALTPRTRDLIDATALRALRPGSFLINVGRGALVVEEALAEALRSGRLAGAWTDVARSEPLPPEDPLWDAPNLVITPHSCSDYQGWEADAAVRWGRNLDRWLAGEPLADLCFSARGY